MKSFEFVLRAKGTLKLWPYEELKLVKYIV